MSATDLLIHSGSFLCALPVSLVLETMRPLPVHPLDGQPPCILGSAVIRGAATTVVDLAVLVGEAPVLPGRFVTLRGAPYALAVEAVKGLAPAGEGRSLALPAGLDPVLATLLDSARLA